MPTDDVACVLLQLLVSAWMSDASALSCALRLGDVNADGQTVMLLPVANYSRGVFALPPGVGDAVASGGTFISVHTLAHPAGMEMSVACICGVNCDSVYCAGDLRGQVCIPGICWMEHLNADPELLQTNVSYGGSLMLTALPAAGVFASQHIVPGVNGTSESVAWTGVPLATDMSCLCLTLLFICTDNNGTRVASIPATTFSQQSISLQAQLAPAAVIVTLNSTAGVLAYSFAVPPRICARLLCAGVLTGVYVDPAGLLQSQSFVAFTPLASLLIFLNGTSALVYTSTNCKCFQRLLFVFQL